MGAPSARAWELSRHWVRLGHDVTVLTGFPNHPTGFVPPEWRPRLRRGVYREAVDGIQVIRTWLLPYPNRKSYERMLNYSSFCISAALRGLEVDRPDVVIATSPQLLVGPAGWWIAKWKRAPFIFEVRDLWPESLTAVGVGAENSMLHRLLGAIAGFLYRRSQKIVVVTEAFKDHLILQWRVPADKIAVVENGVESDIFLPETSEPNLARELNIRDRFVACYVGTMGLAHGLDTIIEAAARLQATRPEVLFLLVGEGADKERIRDLGRTRGLSNLLLVDQQPREKIPAFINASNACLVLLKKTELFKTVIPTKMLEFLSCAKPVVLGVKGQAERLLEEARAGIVIEPESADELVGAIEQLAADPELSRQLGQNGRAYVLEHCSRRRTAELYSQVLQSVVGEWSRSSRQG